MPPLLSLAIYAAYAKPNVKEGRILCYWYEDPVVKHKPRTEGTNWELLKPHWACFTRNLGDIFYEYEDRPNHFYMKIENDIKLDFSDVLIRPKRTTMSSRSQVDLIREFTFPYSSIKWRGVPIMTSNMDSVSTLEIFNCKAICNCGTLI